MEIGERLKEAREEKNISLEDLQETTKIQKRYLIAIEEGNYNILPGKFYAKAFIKEYASAVGLNAQELLQEFEEIQPEEEESTVQYTRLSRSRKDNVTKNSNIFSIIPTIIVIVLVIGIFFVAWSLYQQATKNVGSDPVEQQDNDEIIRNTEENEVDDLPELDTDEEPTPVEPENNESTNDENETDEQELTFEVVEEGTGNSPESTLNLNNIGDEKILTIEADGDTYLDIRGESGESYFSSMFTSADSPMEITVSDEEAIYLNIGNAANTSVIINDTEMDFPVNPNEYVHQKIWIHFN